MELENFKSFAGIKKIRPFHICSSAVVGPNGSGKSNVVDAMLFVFGKRAKKLSLNKVSELIHTSSKFQTRLFPYAHVSVHFQEIIDCNDDNDDTCTGHNTTRTTGTHVSTNNEGPQRVQGCTQLGNRHYENR